ncbi:CPYA [Candida margitis]|uniref:CPYA n=1 Tax=Candida margitis TaxID=1775924 RepID=UPI002226A3D2|nr:CPYA [Candida margitis]KAI5965999.1 CPYA [Candida margitis]
MKFSIATSAVLAMASTGGVSAMTIPFIGQTVLNYFDMNNYIPQFNIINGDEQSNLFSEVSNYFNEPLSILTKETKKLWQEIVLNSELFQKFKSEPPSNKFAKKQKFEYYVKDAKYPNHGIRAKSPKGLGIDSVQQYSGYFDIEDEDKHLFFWLFESRNDPKTDPFVLWINGGPGCASSLGLFFELGPASISKDVKPVHNPYSWNNNATVIFIDSPVNVGYSYSSNSVTTADASAKDIYAFLELFFKQFPQYSKLDFHISGESYAGHYLPAIAGEILSHPERPFNLSSVLIGNGFADVKTQYEYFQPMACGQGGEPSVLEPSECEAMAAGIPLCANLIDRCYKSQSVWDCLPATIYCNQAELTPYEKTGRNLYDIRKECKGQNLCYEGMDYVDEYLSKPEVLKAVGAEVSGHEACNDEVTQRFILNGDLMKPFYRHIVDVLDSGIPVLLYNGDKDFICNWLGVDAWSNKLEWTGSTGFKKSPLRKWQVGGKHAGNVKSYDNFTVLRVFDAGHMVPYDQPAHALDMFTQWVGGQYTF